MAGYNEIRGLRVKYLSADPSNAEDGQVWYNSTTGNLRVQGIGVGAWVSATPGLTARGTAAATGPQTSALVFGGATPSRTTATEEYNGSGWSTGGSLPTATTGMGPARNASQTAALGAGGYDGAKTGASYTYDGSSWTGIPSLGTPRQLYMVGGGTSTSALVFGGDTWPPAPSRNSTATEEYNGTSWTAGGNLGSGGYSGAGTGPQTAAVRMGAPSSGNNTVTENYDGNSWTASGTIPISKSAMSAAGTQTASILFAGIPAPLSTTALEYDGSIYSAIPSPAIQKYNAAGGGTSTSAFMSHGRTPPAAFVATAEEYNFGKNTFTAAAWASGGNMNTARAFLFGVGPKTAAIGAGGYISTFTPTVNSEEYNGTSWTEGNNLNTGRYGISGLGTQTSAVAVGGDARPPGSNRLSNSENYDGSSWANSTAYPIAIRFSAGAGTQAAGVIFGGNVSTGETAQTAEYDGSSWTTAAPQNLNTARSRMGSGGTQTAAIGFGGLEPAASNKTETYNGSTWTVGGTLINSFGSRNAGGGGPNTSTTNILAVGGPPHKTDVEGYDGSAWSTRPSLALGRSDVAGGGTGSSGVIFGGDSAPEVYTAATEEFTGETSVAAPASNITTS